LNENHEEKSTKRPNTRKATSSKQIKKDNKKKRKGAESQEEPPTEPTMSSADKAALLSRFLTAISELQMLGFMCPSARSKDVLLKVAVGGRP